jgi:hypothetical protein
MNDALTEIAGGFAMCTVALVLADVFVSSMCPAAVRWFVLHAVANLIIAAVSVPDAWSSMVDPRSACSGAYSQIPIYMITVLHAYHLIVFPNVSRDDWFHHIVFVGIICFCGFYFKSGPLQNLMAFFICGLPGGLDYLMLAAVKLNLFPRSKEKEWNARINVTF